MGIGMTFIVSPDDIGAVTDALKDLTDIYKIGFVVKGCGVEIL
jgi:phosphoribosylaminoimidazole (AIR) synthetase